VRLAARKEHTVDLAARWCLDNKLAPMAVHEFAIAIKDIAERYGTRVRFEDPKMYFLDVKLVA
jgi:hypothetical protein